MYLVYILRVKDQRETKDEPRNTQRTPYYQKVLFVKIALAIGLVLGDFPPSITCPFFVYCPAESPITLLAFCLFIISNTIEFSSLHRLYPIARRASYRRSRPITSWRFRAIRSLRSLQYIRNCRFHHLSCSRNSHRENFLVFLFVHCLEYHSTLPRL